VKIKAAESCRCQICVGSNLKKCNFWSKNDYKFIFFPTKN